MSHQLTEEALATLRQGLRRRNQVTLHARSIRRHLSAGEAALTPRLVELLDVIARQEERFGWNWQDVEGEVARLTRVMTQSGYVPDADFLAQWLGGIEQAEARLRPVAEIATQRAAERGAALPDGYPGYAPGSIPSLKADNVRVALLSAALGETWVASVPPILIVDPTNVCNFRCRSCFQSLSQDFLHVHLSWPAIKTLLPIMPGVLELRLYGTGEPTLAPELPLLAEASQRAMCLTELLTNGSTLTKRELPLDKIDRLGISFDGATARTFEAIRVGTGFDTLLRSITTFRQNSPDVAMHFNMTVCRANLDEVAAVVDLAVRLGLQGVNFNRFHPFLPVLNFLRLRPADEALFRAQFAQAQQSAKAAGIVLHCDVVFGDLTEDYEPLDKEALLRRLEQTAVNPRPCPAAPSESEEEWSLEFYPGRLGKLMALAVAGDRRRHWREHMPALDQLRPVAEQLAARLRANPVETLVAPYCLAPWMRSYVESTGEVRPCCVYDGHLGVTDDSGFAQVWNGDAYRRLRAAMMGEQPLPPSCASCSSSERYHLLGAFLSALSDIGADVSRLRQPERFHPPTEPSFSFWTDNNRAGREDGGNVGRPEVVDFQPRCVPVGARFAVQDTGLSAIEIHARGAFPGMVLKLAGNFLGTYVDGEILSAVVPHVLHARLFAQPGELDMELWWPGGSAPLGTLQVMAPHLEESGIATPQPLASLAPSLIFAEQLDGEKGEEITIRTSSVGQPEDSVLVVNGTVLLTWRKDGLLVGECPRACLRREGGQDVRLWSRADGELARGTIPVVGPLLRRQDFTEGSVMAVERLTPASVTLDCIAQNETLLVYGHAAHDHMALAVGDHVLPTVVGPDLISANLLPLTVQKKDTQPRELSLIDLKNGLIQSLGHLTVQSLVNRGGWRFGELLGNPVWAPGRLAVGQTFLLQPNGTSILWVKSPTARAGLVLGLDEELMPTSFDGHDTLLAEFSPAAHHRNFCRPAEHGLWVFDPVLRRRQRLGTIFVE